MRGGVILPNPDVVPNFGTYRALADANLAIRDMDALEVDIGPLAWAEVARLHRRELDAAGLDRLRHWLTDSLDRGISMALVPCERKTIGMSAALARMLKHVVSRVVVGCQEELLTSDDPAIPWTEMARVDGLLVGDDYVTVRHRVPFPLRAEPTGLARRSNVLLISSASWGYSRDELMEQVSAWASTGSRLSIPVDVQNPLSSGDLDQAYKAGVREIRLALRSLAPSNRTRSGGKRALSSAAALLLEARRRGIKNSVSLEVGFPGTDTERFLGGLRRLRSIGHLVDAIHDLRTAVDEKHAQRRYDWHDCAANNLSWRRSRGRELAALVAALGIPRPWFFMPMPGEPQGPTEEIGQRLLASL